jgi:hypothetical protein
MEETETADPPGRRGRATVPHTCGNCQSIRYSDAQLLSGRIGGGCARPLKSGRSYVRQDEAGCEEWKRRPLTSRQTDTTRFALIQIQIGKKGRPRGR